MPRFVGGGLGADIPFSHYFPPDHFSKIRSAVAKNVARQGLHAVALERAWGLGRRIVKRIKGIATRKSQSKFVQLTGMKRRRMYNLPSRKRRKITDPSGSYRQLSSNTVKSGRKVSTRRRQTALLKSVICPIRFRFGNVTDINSNQGVFWLSQQQYNATEYRMPVYIANLFTINQLLNGSTDTNLNSQPMFELYRNVSTGAYTWGPVPGKSSLNGTSDVYQRERIAPTEVIDHVLGRKAYLDWTRIRLCIWAKKKNPSQVRVRLVRFLNDEFCPEDSLNKATGYTIAGTSIPKVNEYWENTCRYLLNGPQGGQPRSDKKSYVKTLKEWVINFNPIDAAAETTAASDGRPHMRHLDIFNRWNRSLDFTQPAEVAVKTIDNLRNVNIREQPSREYSGYLREPSKAVYLLIESVQPQADTQAATIGLPRPAPTDTTDLTVSFDFSMESNFSVIEKAL